MTDDTAKQNDDPVLMWRARMLDLVREYRIADDGDEVRAAWKDIREHLEGIPVDAKITPPEWRAGIELQKREIDSLRQTLRNEGERIENLKLCLISLAAVASRYLPDYDEHPAIQAAVDLINLPERI